LKRILGYCSIVYSQRYVKAHSVDKMQLPNIKAGEYVKELLCIKQLKSLTQFQTGEGEEHKDEAGGGEE
jgi:hypothetical protein